MIERETEGCWEQQRAMNRSQWGLPWGDLKGTLFQCWEKWCCTALMEQVPNPCSMKDSHSRSHSIKENKKNNKKIKKKGLLLFSITINSCSESRSDLGALRVMPATHASARLWTRYFPFSLKIDGYSWLCVALAIRSPCACELKPSWCQDINHKITEPALS